MNKSRTRLISLLVALSMVLSLTANGAVAAQLEEASDTSFTAAAEEIESAPEQSQEEPESLPEEEPEAEDSAEETVEAPEAAAEDGEDADQSAQAEEQKEPGEEEAVTPEAQEGDESLDDTDDEPHSVFNVVTTTKLNLDYDDRFSFSKVKSGYVLAKLEDETVKSFQVSAGKKTNTKDKHVLSMNSGSDTNGVAVGTGTVTAYLVKEDELSLAKELLEQGDSATESVDAIQVNVTVSPAPLTIMFLGGQSNMEGWGSKGSGEHHKKDYQHPEQSIVCPDGEVYSTYAPGSTAISGNRANSIGGHVKFSTYCTNKNAKEFIPQTLAGEENNVSCDRTSLEYPVNQLTAAGDGKTGPDSGLAYEWNRLTGDKVWTVNAAVGSSSIEMWVPGGKCYKRAYAIYGYALHVYNSEIKAGHYKRSHQLFFWLQGERDYRMSASKYFNKFQSMHKYLNQALYAINQKYDFDRPGFEHMGIISVRGSGSGASGSSYRSAKDLIMTGPRVVHTYLANTNKLKNVDIVSDVNENWVSDSGVKNYFKKVYGKSLSYKTQGKKPSLPTKVSQVHNDIHYHQVAHNENGITAARGMYRIISGTAKATGVRWRNANGQKITKLKLAKGKSALISPAVSSVPASKSVKWRFSSGLTYVAKTGKLTVTKTGRQKIEALDKKGKVISTLIVN